MIRKNVIKSQTTKSMEVVETDETSWTENADPQELSAQCREYLNKAVACALMAVAMFFEVLFFILCATQTRFNSLSETAILSFAWLTVAMAIGVIPVCMLAIWYHKQSISLFRASSKAI